MTGPITSAYIETRYKVQRIVGHRDIRGGAAYVEVLSCGHTGRSWWVRADTPHDGAVSRRCFECPRQALLNERADYQRDIATLARFAGEVYLLADARVPPHLTWQVRMYNEPRRATPSPVVELRVARGPEGRKVVWMPELVVSNGAESAWPRIIRDGLDKLLHGLVV